MEFVPQTGFGDLVLGMPIAAARDLVPGARRRIGSRTQCLDAGLFLDESADGRLEFIEHFLPAMPVTFDGLDLWDASCLRALVERGHPITLYEGSRASVDYRTIGLAFFLDNRGIQSISAFPRGYYDFDDTPTITIEEPSTLPSWITGGS